MTGDETCATCAFWIFGGCSRIEVTSAGNVMPDHGSAIAYMMNASGADMSHSILKTGPGFSCGLHQRQTPNG